MSSPRTPSPRGLTASLGRVLHHRGVAASQGGVVQGGVLQAMEAGAGAGTAADLATVPRPEPCAARVKHGVSRSPVKSFALGSSPGSP